MKKLPKFRILSPDGFDLDREQTIYKGHIQVLRALINFRNRYISQGYYSSNYGRIELRDIPENCSVIQL